MSKMLDDDPSVVEIRSYYVRRRNALLARGQFTQLYMDYYLHLMQHNIPKRPELDEGIKQLLAAITLHTSSRPQDETCAWTINLHKPLANFFVTASSRPSRVTGRVFTEDVRDSGQNMFVAQLTRPHHQPRQSMIEFHGNDLLEAVEHFYRQSEQRFTRIFTLPDEHFVMISAEPDCDEDWLMALEVDEVATLDTTEHLTPLETRGFVFECGCSIDRLYPLIARLTDDDLDHIFADGIATITCPRCAAVFNTPRDHFNAWRARQPVN